MRNVRPPIMPTNGPKPAGIPRCQRCGGMFSPNADGALRCVICGRPRYPHGPGYWDHKWRKTGNCENCGRSIRLHPNGRRVRCPNCQIADLARRARLKRRRNPRKCQDCPATIAPASHAQRCPDCRAERVRQVRNRAASERRRWARQRST